MEMKGTGVWRLSRCKLQLAAKYSFDFLHLENIFHRRNCNGIWKETEEMAKGKT